MNERFKKEQKLEAKFSAEAQTTGSAAGMELGEFESKWSLYDVFYECCVEGNPADEAEQQCTGSIHRSALPGMQQPKAIDATGEAKSHLPGNIHNNSNMGCTTYCRGLKWLHSQNCNTAK